MRSSRSLIVGVALAALAAGTVRVGAGEPNLGTLRAPLASVSWTGSFDEPFLFPGGVEECNSGVCDRFLLFLDLPEGYFQQNPGSVEFAVRWQSESTDKDLDLYVFDQEGRQVGSSTGQDSAAEVAFVPSPGNGLYDVYVVPVSSPEPLPYEGRIEVEPAAPLDLPGFGRDLLPNLVSLPPRTIALATGQYYIDPVHNTATSCYPEETLDVEKSRSGSLVTRCLRFDQIVANMGEGRLELRFRPDDTLTAPTMYQVIYLSDGSSYARPVPDAMELHAIHGHWHYKGFGRGELYDRAGNPVVQGKKRGFCLIDVDFEMWGQKGNDPRRTSFPGCQTPNDEGWVVEGIDKGWADVYNWFLADQFIDVSSVPNGVYRLQVTANPLPRTLLESFYEDNAVSVWICLLDDSVQKIATPDAPCPF